MYTVLLTTALTALAAASPVPFSKRAGGPVGEPIPDTCTISDPAATLSAEHTYAVSAEFKAANQVYAFYLPQDSDNGQHDRELQTCLEQCYGYGNDGDCVAVYLAYNVPLPADYPWGTHGSPSFGCQFFKTPLSADAFVQTASAQQFTDARARNIECPST